MYNRILYVDQLAIYLHLLLYLLSTYVTVSAQRGLHLQETFSKPLGPAIANSLLLATLPKAAATEEQADRPCIHVTSRLCLQSA